MIYTLKFFSEIRVFFNAVNDGVIIIIVWQWHLVFELFARIKNVWLFFNKINVFYAKNVGLIRRLNRLLLVFELLEFEVARY